MDEFNSEKENSKEVDSQPVGNLEHNDNKQSFEPNAPRQNLSSYSENTSSGNSNRNNSQSNYYNPPQVDSNDNGNQNGYLNEQPNIETDHKKRHNNNNKTLIIVLVIFVVSAVIALVAISGSLLNNSNSNNDSSNGIFSDDKSDSSSSNVGSGEVVLQDSEETVKKDNKGNLTAAGVAEKAMDSCVGIRVYAKTDPYSYFYGHETDNDNENDGHALSGEGSGVIMSEAGGKTYIMTCAHVVEGGDKFVVKTNNGKEYDASLVGFDSQTDIGVIAISGTGFKIAEFGNSDDIEIGEECIAIGCPGGLEFMNSVTKGIVSALARPISSKIGYDNNCIQVDAAINPGNSGGALFNMQGQVIGINSSKIADTNFEGMGFAVPSSTAVEIANSLIKDGYVSGRAKLGVMYNQLSNFNNYKNVIAELDKQGFKNANGVMVIQSIDPDSNLNDKDIKQYDMIVAVNGKTMTSVDVMINTLAKSKPGDKVTLTIARVEGNRIRTFKVDCELIESKD